MPYSNGMMHWQVTFPMLKIAGTLWIQLDITSGPELSKDKF